MKKALSGFILLFILLSSVYVHAWIHVARDGETLEQLASFYYGTGSKAIIIRAANGFMHPDDGSLLQGERVEIPGITYHMVKDGEDWYSLSNIYLGSSRRASFLAELNKSNIDIPPSSGKIVKIPYQLLYIFAPDESLKSVARMFMGKSYNAKWLKEYNLKKRKHYGRGDAVLVPLFNVEYTDAAKKEINKLKENPVSKEDKKAQIEAVKQISLLRKFYENGKYIKIIAIAQKLIASQQLTNPQKIGVYKYLAFAYIAFNEPAMAKLFFIKALKIQPSMELSPITVSPKILTVFIDAQKNFL